MVLFCVCLSFNPDQFLGLRYMSLLPDVIDLYLCSHFRETCQSRVDNDISFDTPERCSFLGSHEESSLPCDKPVEVQVKVLC